MSPKSIIPYLYLPLVIFFSLCIHISFIYFPAVQNGYFTSKTHRKTIDQVKNTIIYAATKFFGTPITNKHHLLGCSEEIKNQCTISSNPDDFSRAKAVVFHARDFTNFGFLDNVNLKLLIRNRKPSVPFVFWTMESPSNEVVKVEDKDLFNWTMSYKNHSDIHFPYSTILPMENPAKIEFDKIWQMKNKETIWLVSNCKTANHRMELVKKMQEKGMKVDIFGKCGTEPLDCPRFGNKSKNCELNLMKPYKFVIAIENSNCVDYVTEKFWKALEKRMVVPIVMSRQYYKNLGIPDSAYVAIDDFKNIDEFLKHLNYVANNKTKYLAFHQWRQNYEIVEVLGVGSNGFGFCKLCERILQIDNQQVERKNTDVKKWHSESAECDNTVANRYL